MDNGIKYKRLIETVGDEYFFYSHNIEGEYLYISPSVERVLGYTVDEARQGLVKHQTESSINKNTKETLRKSASGVQQKTFELELYTKNRQKKIIEITESPLYDEQGKMISIEGVAHDITDRKRDEKLIKEQNKTLTRQKIELEETIQNLKNTQAQLVQSEKMVALGKLVAGIAHEINTPLGAINASVDNISESLKNSMEALHLLFTNFSHEELAVFLEILDLTELKRYTLTSKEKRQYKKAIRAKIELAGFNEVETLTEHLVYLNLYDKMDEVILHLKKIHDPVFIIKSIRNIYSTRKNSANIKLAVEQASVIVAALKRFAHKEQNEEKEYANLIENIETVLTLQHNRLKHGIEVITSYDEIPPILCYPDELVQVWTNLISNAIQAMENKGTLQIKVKNLGDKVQVKLSDSGCGIPQEIQEKVFDPFFTTKKAGEGTGIGLNLVKKIIDKHQAKLTLKSEVGKGATFCITLPVNE